MQPNFFSYPLWEAVNLIWFLSSTKSKLLILKVFLIEFPNTLLISLFLSNFVTEVSFKVKVDCADVKRLKSFALIGRNFIERYSDLI